MVDKFSMFCVLIPTTTDVTGALCAQLLVDNVYEYFGWPVEIVSDRDPKFTSSFWKTLHTYQGTQLDMSTAFHPQTDGQTEVYNRILEDMLRHYVSPYLDDWDKWLPCAQFAINNAFVESIGCTPSFLNFGRHPRTPLSVFLQQQISSRSQTAEVPSATDLATALQQRTARARELLLNSRNRMKQVADKSRSEVHFQVGEQVLLNTKNLSFKGRSCRKLLPRWIGPFTISATVGSVAYKLDLPPSVNIHPVFHVSLLRKYYPSARKPPPPPPEVVDGEEEYVVERILDHRVSKRRGRKKFFLVRWAGYGAEHDSWEPIDNLDNCPDALQDYWKYYESANRRKRKAGH